MLLRANHSDRRYTRYHVAAATTAEFAAEALPFTILIFVVSGESRHGRAACRQCITQQASGIGRDGGPARATAGAAADKSGAIRRDDAAVRSRYPASGDPCQTAAGAKCLVPPGRVSSADL